MEGGAVRPHMHIVTSSDDHHTVGGAGGGVGLRHAACGRRRGHNGVGTRAVPIEGGMTQYPTCAREVAAQRRPAHEVASDSGRLTAGMNQYKKADFGAQVQARAPIFLRAHLTCAIQNTAVEHEYAVFYRNSK